MRRFYGQGEPAEILREDLWEMVPGGNYMRMKAGSQPTPLPVAMRNEQISERDFESLCLTAKARLPVKVKQDDIDRWFDPRKPTRVDAPKISALRASGQALVEQIVEQTPGSADQNAAVRKVREAVDTAVAAILCNPSVEASKPR